MKYENEIESVLQRNFRKEWMSDEDWKRVYKTLSSLKADKASIECVFALFSIKLADEILQQLENK